jgi:hypothetical protein
MWIVFVGQEVREAHMVEAALISHYQSEAGCRNQPNSGGEGGLLRGNAGGPPYFVYVTGGRADQPKWVG